MSGFRQYQDAVQGYGAQMSNLQNFMNNYDSQAYSTFNNKIQEVQEKGRTLMELGGALEGSYLGLKVLGQGISKAYNVITGTGPAEGTDFLPAVSDIKAIGSNLADQAVAQGESLAGKAVSGITSLAGDAEAGGSSLASQAMGLVSAVKGAVPEGFDISQVPTSLAELQSTGLALGKATAQGLLPEGAGVVGEVPTSLAGLQASGMALGKSVASDLLPEGAGVVGEVPTSLAGLQASGLALGKSVASDLLPEGAGVAGEVPTSLAGLQGLGISLGKATAQSFLPEGVSVGEMPTISLSGLQNLGVSVGRVSAQSLLPEGAGTYLGDVPTSLGSLQSLGSSVAQQAQQTGTELAQQAIAQGQSQISDLASSAGQVVAETNPEALAGLVSTSLGQTGQGVAGGGAGALASSLAAKVGAQAAQKGVASIPEQAGDIEMTTFSSSGGDVAPAISETALGVDGSVVTTTSAAATGAEVGAEVGATVAEVAGAVASVAFTAVPVVGGLIALGMGLYDLFHHQSSYKPPPPPQNLVSIRGEVIDPSYDSVTQNQPQSSAF